MRCQNHRILGVSANFGQAQTYTILHTDCSFFVPVSWIGEFLDERRLCLQCPLGLVIKNQSWKELEHESRGLPGSPTLFEYYSNIFWMVNAIVAYTFSFTEPSGSQGSSSSSRPQAMLYWLCSDASDRCDQLLSFGWRKEPSRFRVIQTATNSNIIRGQLSWTMISFYQWFLLFCSSTTCQPANPRIIRAIFNWRWDKNSRCQIDGH